MNNRSTRRAGRSVRAVGTRLCLYVLFPALLLILCRPIWAAPAQAAGDEPCVECHSLEAGTWEHSAHAAQVGPDGAAAAQCVDCHGAYSEQHPDDDLMALDVSSATCATCHTNTYAQWQTTIHASNDVQCIGCHQAHSQELRLAEQTLCASCHTTPNDDEFHEAHWLADTACIDCHMAGAAPDGQLAAVLDGANFAIAASAALVPTGPDHDFVTVSPRLCLDCHREDVQSTTSSHTAVEARLLEREQANTMLANQLDATQKNLHTFQGMTPVALGMGLGLGGMLGIVFMLVFARTERTKPEDSASEPTDAGDVS